MLAVVLAVWAVVAGVCDVRVLPNENALMKAAKREAAYVPAPKTVNWVKGVAPGQPADVMSPAQTVRETGTIYYSQPLDRFSKAHEVGHLFDAQALSDGDRAYFQKLLQAPSGAWRQAPGRPGPSEVFADYYGAAALGMDARYEQPGSYENIGPKRLQRFESAIARVGRRKGLTAYQP